ncbi:uncharacterized protein RJT21DRAFT_118969 [Scheffersomyces amazonensis]|uniref:uncharacterized protein n=1 Tax=Scheffersomyces amazonensis TaxID=1078765 RepID=UPI00315D9C76
MCTINTYSLTKRVCLHMANLYKIAIWAIKPLARSTLFADSCTFLCILWIMFNLVSYLYLYLT